MHALCLSQNVLRGCGGAKPSLLPLTNRAVAIR